MRLRDCLQFQPTIWKASVWQYSYISRAGQFATKRTASRREVVWPGVTNVPISTLLFCRNLQRNWTFIQCSAPIKSHNCLLSDSLSRLPVNMSFLGLWFLRCRSLSLDMWRGRKNRVLFWCLFRLSRLARFFGSVIAHKQESSFFWTTSAHHTYQSYRRLLFDKWTLTLICPEGQKT